MASREIKSKLVLEGEKEYRAGLDEAYKSVSNLGRQLKVTDAQFLDNANSMDAHKAKSEALRKEIDAQKDIIRSLTERMQYCEETYGDNTEAQELYASKIDKAMRALGKMESELAKNEKAMEDMGDASEDAGNGLNKAENHVKDMGEAAKNAENSIEKLSGGFTVMKGAIANLVSDALRSGAQQLKDFAVGSIELASNLDEVDNVVSTAFGNATGEVKAFADNAATQFGLSSLSAQEYAGKLGAALNAMGLEGKAQEMSTTLTGLSGDLASFWNMSSDETYAKLFSGVISGESEGLKALGIVMSETNLQSFALEQGIQKKTSAMTAAEKAELRYQYVLNATSQAQGDFAKTSDGYANQMRIAALQTENAQAALGQKLLPTITSVVGKFNEFLGSNSGQKAIEGIADAAGDLANGAMSLLQTSLGWISEHLELIKGAVEAIGIGFLAAKLTGFAMTIVKLASGLKAAAASTSLLNAAMAANPVGLVAIGVAALAAGIIALSANAHTLSDELANLKLEVPQSSVDAVTGGINAGIEAADRVHEVTVQINADTAELKEQLDSMFDDDSAGGSKMTRKEFKAISKYVTDMVQPDIDAAKEAMKAQKEDFQATLLSITDDNGDSVFSAENAESLANSVSQKTQDIVAELEQYKTDYIALAKEIYKDGDTPTEEEITRLNDLLDKIGEVRTRLNEAQDQAVQVQKAKTERVMRGNGTEEDFGAAIGYLQQTYANKATDAHAENERVIAGLQGQIDAMKTVLANGQTVLEDGTTTVDAIDKLTQSIESVMTADEQVDAAVFEEQQQALQDLFDGFAKSNPEAMAAIENLEKLRDTYASVLSSMEKDSLTDQAKNILTDENIKQFLPDVNITEADVSAAIDSENFEWTASWVIKMQAAIEDQISAESTGMKDNPVVGWLQGMMDQGSFETMDMTKLSGGLESAFKAMDLLARGRDVGEDLVSGLEAGIGTGTEGMTQNETNALRDKVIENTRAAFDSHSPARVMIPIGEDITAGIAVGMQDDTATGSVGNAATAMVQIIKDMFDMSNVGGDAMESFGNGMRSRQYSVTSKAGAIATAAKNAMQNKRSGFVQAGSDAIDGFAQGMEVRAAAATAAAAKIALDILNGMRNALGIASPSKEFAKLGRYSAEGFEIGFSEQMDAAEKAINDRMQFGQEQSSIVRTQGGVETKKGESAIHITQNVYANETSYADQQREAARQFQRIARGITA